PVGDPVWRGELSDPLEDESLEVESLDDVPLDEPESDELDVSLELDVSDVPDVVPELSVPVEDPSEYDVSPLDDVSPLYDDVSVPEDTVDSVPDAYELVSEVVGEPGLDTAQGEPRPGPS